MAAEIWLQEIVTLQDECLVLRPQVIDDHQLNQGTPPNGQDRVTLVLKHRGMAISPAQ